MKPVELLMHRRQIAAWLKADQVQVVLWRSEKIQTPTAAWVEGDPLPLAPQWVRLIPFKRRLTDMVFNNTAGKVEDLPYVMVGDHNLNVKQDDTFTWEGQEYKVDSIDVKREVRIAAAVDYRGGDPENE